MDMVGDFLTRIRNAHMGGHKKVDVPSSNIRKGIARVLEEQSYIEKFKVIKDSKQGMMRVYLKYDEKGRPSLSRIKRYSRPGRREYVKVDGIPNVRAGYGLAILSTSQGIMSGGQAREKNVGGELLCVVW